jgi:hypothetical protein
MKKIVIIVLLPLIIFLLTGCNRIGKYVSVESIDTVPGLSIEVNEDTLTNESLEYIIRNDTNKQITYNTPDWIIQVYENNEWYDYTIEYLWVTEDKVIEASSYIKEKVNFEGVYGNLKKGRHRFIKLINGWHLADEF